MNPLQQKGTEKERGAALLTVLLLVAVIAILAAHGIDRLAGATKLASNARELSQAKAYLIAAESIGMESAEQIVSASPGRTINVGGWNGAEQKFPVPGGIIAATLAGATGRACAIFAADGDAGHIGRRRRRHRGIGCGLDRQ